MSLPLFSLSPQDENQGGKEGEGWPEADCSPKEEESVEAGCAEEEGPEETDPVHQEWRQLPLLPAGQPGLQLPHHGPQGGPATAAHVHSQVGQEEQGAQVRHQVHEVPSVSHLPHRLPVMLYFDRSPRSTLFRLIHVSIMCPWTPDPCQICYRPTTQSWSSFYFLSFKHESGTQGDRPDRLRRIRHINGGGGETCSHLRIIEARQKPQTL